MHPWDLLMGFVVLLMLYIFAIRGREPSYWSVARTHPRALNPQIKIVLIIRSSRSKISLRRLRIRSWRKGVKRGSKWWRWSRMKLTRRNTGELKGEGYCMRLRVERVKAYRKSGREETIGKESWAGVRRWMRICNWETEKDDAWMGCRRLGTDRETGRWERQMAGKEEGRSEAGDGKGEIETRAAGSR